MATQSLSYHSSHERASPSYMLLRCALLLRSQQRSEASEQTIDWLRSDTSLSYEASYASPHPDPEPI